MEISTHYYKENESSEQEKESNLQKFVVDEQLSLEVSVQKAMAPRAARWPGETHSQPT